MKLKDIRIGRHFKIPAKELGLNSNRIITCQRLFTKVVDHQSGQEFVLDLETEVMSNG